MSITAETIKSLKDYIIMLKVISLIYGLILILLIIMSGGRVGDNYDFGYERISAK